MKPTSRKSRESIQGAAKIAECVRAALVQRGRREEEIVLTWQRASAPLSRGSAELQATLAECASVRQFFSLEELEVGQSIAPERRKKHTRSRGPPPRGHLTAQRLAHQGDGVRIAYAAVGTVGRANRSYGKQRPRGSGFVLHSHQCLSDSETCGSEIA